MTISGVEILKQEIGEFELLYMLHVPVDSIYFKGHFPGRPILPGVTQVDWVVSLSQPLLVVDAIKSLERVKFMRPIRPNSNVSVKLTLSSEGRCLSYRFFDNAGDYSSGHLIFG
ncbi:(3R)-hydroxymyristoyl-[ACP] dehydratase [hydrothermal vent metagenome]|uniref:(3R)-hydroxymyristoyl-[ACP] dehydratase n=1 Tax=hydrothermal vent metagenome TaxID=652676 RepID=A0A3B0ZUK9_9ZZZZ